MANAAYSNFAEGTFTKNLGLRSSLSFFHRHFWTMAVCFFLALVSKQFRFPSKQEGPYVWIAGIFNIFLSFQLQTKTSDIWKFELAVIWQPLFPVFILSAVLILRIDIFTIKKVVGAILWFIVCSIFVIYNAFTSENAFLQTYFMIMRILAPLIGALSLRSAIFIGTIGVFNLAFWITFTATICSFMHYTIQYIHDPSPPFFSYAYQLSLMDIPWIFSFRIAIDVYNICFFIYISMKRQMVKGAVYSSLDTFFTIWFFLFFDVYSSWIYLYIVMVYVGYSLIVYNRTQPLTSTPRKKIRVKFISNTNNQDSEAFFDQKFTFSTEVNTNSIKNTFN